MLDWEIRRLIEVKSAPIEATLERLHTVLGLRGFDRYFHYVREVVIALIIYI